MPQMLVSMKEKPYEPVKIYLAKNIEDLRSKCEVDLREYENLSIPE